MRLVGRVVSSPFGPGAPLLETDEGARYALAADENGVVAMKLRAEGAERP